MKVTPLYKLCNACNYNLHRCHFCGDYLTHDQAVRGSRSVNPHPCYLLVTEGADIDDELIDAYLDEELHPIYE